MFDHNGERMTPTHASNKGRRYRYYVSHSLIERGRPKASDTARRVPVSELERLVEQRLVAFLHDEGALHDALVPGAPRAHEVETLIAEAATLAERWPRLSAVEKRRRLQAFVVVGDGGSRRFERTHPARTTDGSVFFWSRSSRSGCDDVMDLSLCGVAFLWESSPASEPHEKVRGGKDP